MSPHSSVTAGVPQSVTKYLRLLIAVLLVTAGTVHLTTGADASPVSDFEIDDANIVDAAGAPQDWGSMFGRTGGAGPVVAKNTAAFAAASFTEDSMSSDDLPSPPCLPGKKGDLTVFTSGGSDKNGDALNTWTYESGSVPNSKDDLTNVYAAALNDASKSVFYFALDRANTNGSAHLDFEFLKSAFGTNPTKTDSSGCPSGNFTGTRTAGDILLSMNFTNGGTLGTTEIRVWDGDSYEVVNAGAAMDLFQNGSPIACGDWRCRNEAGATITQLPANAFVEGFIDAKALGLTGCYSSYNAKSRSSHEWNSELKDIALGNFNTCEARIKLTPNGVNEVGDAHVFTAHADVRPGLDFEPVPAGTKIDLGLKSGPGALSAPFCLTVANTGSCQVTLNSASAGTTVVTAATTVQVGPLTLTRSTDGNAGPGGTGNAVKEWADGYIKVTPDGVNPVNQKHVFNVEFGVMPGGAPSVTGVAIVADAAPNPASESSTCATPTLAGSNVWKCTVEINSPEAKVFQVEATGTATVSKPGAGSVTITRSTDSNVAPHGPGGNNGATKTYVDARIKIGPDGLNEVNDEHTVTATVEVKDGDGAWSPAPNGTKVDFADTGAGGFVSGIKTCNTAGGNGQCSVKIVSADVGTTNVSATTTVVVHGQSLTRSTNGQAGNSGPLTKRWADASIKVEKTAFNEVNDDHEFTVTVTAHKPANETVTFGSITPSVKPAPNFENSTCNAPQVIGNVATCKFTINSPSAGVFDVDATAIVKFDDGSNPELSITRSTDPLVASAGPGGNQGATKTYVDARVSLGLDGVNAVGDPHKVTGKAEFADDAGGFKPADGETIEFNIVQGVGSFVNGIDSCTADANGECSVAIVSNVPGVTWVAAETSYVVQTVLLNRVSAVNPTDDANLRKEWVDAKIEITPDAVNPVDEEHKFAIKVTGSSSGAPINFGAITTSVLPVPSSATDTCTTPLKTATTATCELTINSSDAGVFTANAKATVTIGGVVLNLETNGQNNNSGPAVKTYVDARIHVGPDGVNAVGDPHPVNARLEINDGSGWKNAPAGETIELKLLSGPGALSADSCVTDADGECSATLNSPATGTTVVSATATVRVLNVALTRSTHSDAGPGGSDDLVKHWVNASITITPDGINPVNDAHVFTITVTAGSVAAGLPVTFGAISTDVDPAPSSKSDTCATPVTTADSATCTLTINSTTAGTFVANATANVTIGGVTVKRSTDSTVAPAGPNGSGPATKHYTDAYIKVTPDDVNPVNEQHVFDVEFGVMPGGTDSVTDVSIDAGISPTPSSETSTCATPVASPINVWKCTVTINSDEAKVFQAEATGKATLTKAGVPGSVTLTRSTDSAVAPHGPGGNDGATKTYVDARIKIGPDGLNEVNDEHTVNATVEVKDGDGPWTLASAGTNIEFQLTGAGAFVSNVDECSTLNATGACSVKIVSANVGTTNVSAETTVAVNGKSLTRTTDGQRGNSGPLTKRWADASIRVEETAFNEVNDAHTFTVTVLAHRPGNETVDFTSIVPSVLPITGLVAGSSTCSTPTVAADGQSATCTFKVNSAVAGIFDADAVGTVIFDKGKTPELSVTRSTSGNAGPNGNEGATKTFVDATVRIGPDGVNAVGDAHTVTGTAEFDDGTGPKPAVNETITFNITAGVGSFVNGKSTCVTGSNGTCTVQINSAVPGVTWVSAKTSYEVQGVILNRTTAESGATDPDNLRKEWVDAKIEITPDGVNEVGDPHTFDVKVTASSSGAVVNFGAITTSVTPTPGTSSNTCATPQVDAGVAKCTLTVNNPTADIFTANASATVTIGGVVFNLTTNGQGNNSGPATKTYVDADIQVTPDGVNEVGDPHTVTGHVNVDNGTGSASAPAGTVITFNIASGPGSLSANQCATVATTGSCSVTLNSSQPGVTLVNAATAVEVEGLVLNRSTSGQGANSDNLQKRWVDGLITIGPSAVNPLNEPHDFTVTVTGIPSGATPVAFGPITVSVAPAPDVQTNTCAAPKVDGNVATCTLTINSGSPAVFTANATATITMGGTAIVRSTDVTVAPAGPGGSGPAIKTYEGPPPPEVQGVQFLPRTGDFLMKNLWFGAILALAGAAISRLNRRRRIEL